MTAFVSYPNLYPGKSSFLKFLQNKTLITNDEEDLIPRKEFGIAYREFCTENGFQQASVVDFVRHLTFLGIEGKPTNVGDQLYYSFCGVAWKKKEDMQVVVKEEPEKEFLLDIALRNSHAIYEGRESFIAFCQSRLIFSNRSENQVILEELHISYQKFCFEQRLVEGSFADIVNHFLSSGFDCLRVELDGRALYHSVFGVALIYDVNENGRVDKSPLSRERNLPLIKKELWVYSSSEGPKNGAYHEKDFVRTPNSKQLVAGEHLEDNLKSLKNKDEHYSEAGRQENSDFIDSNFTRKSLRSQFRVPLEIERKMPCNNIKFSCKRSENTEQCVGGVQVDDNSKRSQNENRHSDIQIRSKEQNAARGTFAEIKKASNSREKGKSRHESLKLGRTTKTRGSVSNFVERSEKPKRWVKAVQLEDILKCSKNTTATDPLRGINENHGDTLKCSENQTLSRGDVCKDSNDILDCSKQQINACSVVVEDFRHKLKSPENEIVPLDDVRRIKKEDHCSNNNVHSTASECFNAVENSKDDLIAMAKYIGGTDRQKRWVTGVLLRDIRRHPIYQRKLHFYKDENNDWVLFPPSFSYSGVNSFRRFFKENINVSGKSHNLILYSDLYKAYQKFCFRRSLLQASADDVGHHLSVVGIRSVEKIIKPNSSKRAYSGLLWKCQVLAEKYGNMQFKVMLHNCHV